MSTRIAHVAYDLAKTSFNTNNMNKAIQWLSLAIKHCPQIAAFYTARARAHHTLKVTSGLCVVWEKRLASFATGKVYQMVFTITQTDWLVRLYNL